MGRVAFEIDRTPHVALDEHSARVPVDGNRRSKELGFPRNNPLRGLNIRHDRLVRLVSTPAAQAAQGQRRRHVLEEIAATGLIQHLDRRVRKLEARRRDGRPAGS